MLSWRWSGGVLGGKAGVRPPHVLLGVEHEWVGGWEGGMQCRDETTSRHTPNTWHTWHHSQLKMLSHRLCCMYTSRRENLATVGSHTSQYSAHNGVVTGSTKQSWRQSRGGEGHTRAAAGVRAFASEHAAGRFFGAGHRHRASPSPAAPLRSNACWQARPPPPSTGASIHQQRCSSAVFAAGERGSPPPRPPRGTLCSGEHHRRTWEFAQLL